MLGVLIEILFSKIARILRTIKYYGFTDEFISDLLECRIVIRDIFRIMKDPYIMPNEECMNVYIIYPKHSGLELPMLISIVRNHHQLIRVSGLEFTNEIDPNDDFIRIPLDDPDNWSIDTGFKPGSYHYFNIENYDMSEYVDFVKQNLPMLRKMSDPKSYIDDLVEWDIMDMGNKFIKKEE